MLKVIESNGVDEDIDVLTESNDSDVAKMALFENLMRTASIGYSVPVVEWWFTGRDQPLVMQNGDGWTDTYIWEGIH